MSVDKSEITYRKLIEMTECEIKILEEKNEQAQLEIKFLKKAIEKKMNLIDSMRTVLSHLEAAVRCPHNPNVSYFCKHHEHHYFNYNGIS